MRAMVKKRFSMGVVLLTAMFAAANCDSGDTVVSVNVSFDASAMDVQAAASSLRITITPRSGHAPDPTDVPLMRTDAGAITTPTYKRITVNGASGSVDVTVDARDGSGATLLSASTTADLVEHGAVAAFVKFARVTPDAGADDASSGDGGSAGTDAAAGTGGASGGTGSGGTGSGGA